MKKITFLLAAVLFITTAKTNAQDDANRDCSIKYNLFKGDFQSKKYEEAYVNWIYLMDNCKDLSVNIYKYGATLAEDVKKDPALAKRVYEQRLEFFPKQNPAKVHSDYATYLADNKLSSEEEIFSILEKGYSIDPTKMGVKNLYKYFQGVTDRNKDANPQKVFDTYDDVLENVNKKLEGYAVQLKKLSVDTVANKKKIHAYSVNSRALGTVEGGLDAIVSDIAKCENLIPLYNKNFEAHKSDAVWLKRAVSRLFNKECQEDPLYQKLVRAYAEASPSPEAYSFLASVLEDNGDNAGAEEMRQKSFDLETDPLKKAKYKLKFAQSAKSKGQLSKARSLAREAIGLNPNSGRAYLFIASLYASSANSCGSNEFEKRMVYVAALNQAQRAASVDPSISAVAGRYIRSYRANVPSQKVIFTAGVNPGSSHTIKCWIGQTVKVPSK
ncbi:tetratricopeptide repeat protein [Polaribacter sp. Asnod1-A03]|uniref:tetratricopeptide repeat protein n=1 Tax=Polaribacter sp. Asnod1-A03 TaxID=3160581 RepID=UPI00386674DF